MRLVVFMAVFAGCSSAPTVTPAIREAQQLEAEVRILELRTERLADNLEAQMPIARTCLELPMRQARVAEEVEVLRGEFCAAAGLNRL